MFDDLSSYNTFWVYGFSFLIIGVTTVYYLYNYSLRFSKFKKPQHDLPPQPVLQVPESVNYFFSRECNYNCKFCFHTALNSKHATLEEAKKALALLASAGMNKINFSGGEPLLLDNGAYLGELCRYCKTELNQAVSFISNGSLMKEEWIKEFSPYIDIIAISCDSFDSRTNKKIGRYDLKLKQDHLTGVFQIAEWCKKYNVLFKLNTVVNRYNVGEDMTQEVLKLNPIRWKVFQCLLLEGENTGKDSLRHAENLTISDYEFDEFLKRHEKIPFLVPESNEVMKDSYLLLDEQLRFLNCTENKKVPTVSILEDLQLALRQSGWDYDTYHNRGGRYKHWLEVIGGGMVNKFKEKLLDW